MGIKVHTGESNGYSPGTYYKASKQAVIDVKDEASLETWSGILKLSKKELLEAIENFGPVVRDIRRGLRQNQDDAA